MKGNRGLYNKTAAYLESQESVISDEIQVLEIHWF